VVKGSFALDVELALHMPTVATLRWNNPVEAIYRVRYGEGALFLDGPSVEGSGSLEVELRGLSYDESYAFQVVEDVDGALAYSDRVDLRTPLEPATYAGWQVAILDPDAAQADDGFLILNQFDTGRSNSTAVVLNGHGDAVWVRVSDGYPFKIIRIRPAGAGGLSIASYHWEREEDLGQIDRYAWTGERLSTTRALEMHHDFVETRPGQLTWLSFLFDEVLIRGRFHEELLATDAVRTSAEGTAEAVDERLFDFFRDYGVDPWFVCDHVETNDFPPHNALEWTHSNSLAYVEDEDALYVMVRFLDTVLKLDAATGELLWQLGGDHSGFPSVGELAFDHGHMSHVWPGGFLVFDNGDHRENKISRVVEYAVDEATMTAEAVWSYDEPDGTFHSFLGDARRLPGGNTLIAWPARRRIDEVTPDGRVVWSATSEHIPGRVMWVPSLDGL
jgi:hypothetical protein